MATKADVESASSSARERNGRPPLIQGRFMNCPRCKNRHDILQYEMLGIIEEYIDETLPVYKCPGCRWVFAPAPETVKEAVGL